MKRFAFVLLCLTAPLTAHAQSASPDTSADRSGYAGTEVWAGFSNRSSKWGILGNRAGMSFGIAAARMTRRIKTKEEYALDYTVDIIPVALASPPLGYDIAGKPNFPQESCRLSCRFPSGSALGAGISPIGFTAIYRRGSRVQPRIGATGGALFFDRAVPTVISTRFNFTATLEAGTQILNHAGDGVLLVYRFHHLSNAGTGYDNSALASHIISLGARWRVGN